MATIRRHKVSSVLPPLSIGQGKPVVMPQMKTAANTGPGRNLLRRPRVPAPPELPPEPPEPPESPEPSKSMGSELSHVNSYAGLYRYSPEPSVHPSVVSPPPPSELQSQHNYPPHRPQPHSRRPVAPAGYLLKGDTKYVLDPLYRDKTNVGTYVEGRALVRPYRLRGPGSLPTRPPRRNPQLGFYPISADLDGEVEADIGAQPSAFTLQDFLIKVSHAQRLPLEKVKQAMFSRHNYLKIQRLLAKELLPRQTDVNITNLKPPVDMPHVTPRVPQRQLLLEMAALVKEQMSESMNTEMKAVIRPLPKYSPSYPIGSAMPHTEILLYEASSNERNGQKPKEPEVPGKDTLFHSWCGRYFHGSHRSDSPFDENLISPAELAVLDSLMSGGSALSLKANFIASLPDMESLAHTITYLNLSFNDFRMIPMEVLNLRQLSVLKLRNNPLQQIPVEIDRLQNLRVLVLSFCLIAELPPSLFNCSNLEHLDIAYNKVQKLPNAIKNLWSLRELNVEGNQLIGMPMGALRLRNLTRLKVSNNYMHPMFWRENCQRSPQRLCDVAALNFVSAGLRNRYPRIPDYVKHILDSASSCECCGGPLYGSGLCVIRPVAKIFGVRNLPFLFSCCSPYCKEGFMASTDTLTDMLYGNSDFPEEADVEHYEAAHVPEPCDQVEVRATPERAAPPVAQVEPQAEQAEDTAHTEHQAPEDAESSALR